MDPTTRQEQVGPTPAPRAPARGCAGPAWWTCQSAAASEPADAAQELLLHLQVKVGTELRKTSAMYVGTIKDGWKLLETRGLTPSVSVDFTLRWPEGITSNSSGGRSIAPIAGGNEPKGGKSKAKIARWKEGDFLTRPWCYSAAFKMLLDHKMVVICGDGFSIQPATPFYCNPRNHWFSTGPAMILGAQ